MSNESKDNYWSSNEVDELGGKMITLVEHEDPNVVLTVLTFLAATMCGVIADDDPEGFKQMAEGFIRTFREVVDNKGDDSVLVH